MKKLIIGLTGGIASGKSTVSELFKNLGATIIDADQITREICAPNSPFLEKISKKFGQHILNNDQTLNRRKLSQIIFKNPEKRIWLENLLHPEVQKIMNKRAIKAHSNYVILVIPLLLETKFPPKYDQLLVIDTLLKNQQERLRKRNLTKQEIQAILDTQTTQEKRLEKADDIIKNNGDLKQLEEQVKQLHQKYLKEGKAS